MTDQTAKLDWRDGVPIAVAFDDPYYSLDDGLAETRHVFLDGNDLPARFVDGGHFCIAELGFGTGLNFLATVLAWTRAGYSGTLHFVSFEKYPMRADDMQNALKAFPEVSRPAAALVAIRDRLATETVKLAYGITLTLVIGDARDTVPSWDGAADAWFLDGFSPSKNPELWEADLLQAVGQHTKPGGTAATYSAAGHVRQALTDAGFEVTRAPGYGRKRHMTRAVMTDAE